LHQVSGGLTARASTKATCDTSSAAPGVEILSGCVGFPHSAYPTKIRPLALLGDTFVSLRRHDVYLSPGTSHATLAFMSACSEIWQVGRWWRRWNAIIEGGSFEASVRRSNAPVGKLQGFFERMRIRAMQHAMAFGEGGLQGPCQAPPLQDCPGRWRILQHLRRLKLPHIHRACPYCMAEISRVVQHINRMPVSASHSTHLRDRGIWAWLRLGLVEQDPPKAAK